MKRLIWTRRASADLRDVLRYYHEIDFALGESLFVRILAAPNPLLDRPALGSLIGRYGLRKWRVNHTPFLLFYRVRKDGTVEILRVRHDRQDWRTE